VTRRAATLLLLAVIVACAIKPGGPPRTGPKLVVVPVGARPPASAPCVVFVELAATQQARERGLGGRASLPRDGAMLFVYGADEPRRYWMKDCLIALDIAFIERGGRIVNVATLPPGAGLKNEDIAAVDSTAPARFVLETAAGWCAAHGIAAGDEVDLRAALVGVDPR
jgi:uncharacterized membrane protein (UPF0127 family)